jgi:crotonobetainyl-CoA:carnitine CoA-transferase CaiB-like acyl-CoA transferase
MSKDGVLSGIKVLDFGRYVAGPYCAALLAEFGAEVIRIEKPGGSEDRYLMPVSPTGDGALFMQMNRNKLSMTLDPATPQGREVVAQLVAGADVVVANLPAPTLGKMGLDYASLSGINPRIILTHVSAFGSNGPLRNHLGFDAVAQAMSGGVYLSGPPGLPQKSQIVWADFGTALHSAYGTLAALLARAKTGRGQVVETSLFATAAMFGSGLIAEQALTGVDRQAIGNRSFMAAPSDLYRTRDGWISCTVAGQPLFERWARLTDNVAWLDDARFASDTTRGQHGELVSERMQQWCGDLSTDEALASLAAAKIPAGPVLRPGEVVDHPQTVATALFQPVEYPQVDRPVPVARAPVFLSETPGGIRSRAPRVGEHTVQILSGLGYSTEAIRQLEEIGVI